MDAQCYHCVALIIDEFLIMKTAKDFKKKKRPDLDQYTV